MSDESWLYFRGFRDPLRVALSSRVTITKSTIWKPPVRSSRYTIIVRPVGDNATKSSCFTFKWLPSAI